MSKFFENGIYNFYESINKEDMGNQMADNITKKIITKVLPSF